MPLEPELLELENELRKLAPLELDFPNGQRVMGALTEEITTYSGASARPDGGTDVVSAGTLRPLGAGSRRSAAALQASPRFWNTGALWAAAAALVLIGMAWRPLDATWVRQTLAKLTTAAPVLADEGEPASPLRRARIAPIYPTSEEVELRSHLLDERQGSSYEANGGSLPREPLRFTRVPEATSPYGFLDVKQTFALPPDYCKSKGIEGGVVLSELGVNGPAARQGLEAGDIVLSINDKPIRTSEEFCRTIRSTPPGTKVRMKIRRYHIFMEILVRLDSAPSA